MAGKNVTKKKKSKAKAKGADSKSALDSVISKWGEQIINKGMDSKPNVKRISTGVLGIDHIFGINEDGTGGVPKGRIVEFYGPESSGKTALALFIIGQLQKSDPDAVAAFIDLEHTLTKKRCRELGVDPSRLIIVTPDYGEEALQVMKDLIDTGEVSLIALDSISALVPKSELEGEVGSSAVGKQARIMSAALRQMCAAISRTNTTAIFINQLREKIGVMFGNPEVTSGGNSMKFYASLRVSVRKGKQILDGEEAIGSLVTIKCEKNKTASPFKKGVFKFIYKTGFSKELDILDWAVEFGLVKKSGSWYSIGDEKMGQGETKALEWLKANPHRYHELRDICAMKLAERDKQEEEEARMQYNESNANFEESQEIKNEESDTAKEEEREPEEA